MSGASKPWMKFYPQDWRADEKLRNCSLAARGLWIEMLSLMHRSERYGTLLIGGHVPTNEQIAIQVGAPIDVVVSGLAELDRAGVFSRASGDAIYSRRMKRDEKKAKNARSNGRKGGNPALKANDEKQRENSASDKGEPIQDLLEPLKPQIPEARDQIYSVDKSTGETPPDPIKEIFDLGVSVLTSTGSDEKSARSLVGRWRKTHGDAETLLALTEAQRLTISQPIEWIQARLVKKGGETDAYFAHLDLKYGGAR